MKQDFNANSWIERLAGGVVALAERVEPRVPGERVDDFGRAHGYTGVVSREEYRSLAVRAQHDPDAEVAFEESYLWLDDDPAEVKAVLREHPVIRQALGRSGHDEATQFLKPYGQFRVELETLALSLTKLAFKTDAKNAGETLHRFLTLGEARDLKAYEVTLFYGLKLDARLDIGEGAFLAPYEDTKVFCGEYPFLRFKPFPAGIEQRHPLDDAPQNIAALVRELTWGPAIASTEVELENSLITRFRFTIEEEDAEHSPFSFQFAKDHETVRDFLCIATGKPQVSRRQYIRVDRWMEDLDPNIRFGWTSGRRWVNDWWRESQLSEDAARTFLELIRRWPTYQGDRKRLRLAIRRLAALPSRAGRFGTADQLLDIAIALETMYNLDTPEITYKLQTRTGYYLGTDREERIDIFHKVKNFYRARSALVHGSSGKRHRIDVSTALSDGLNLARKTLLALLRDGEPPDWTCLVMSAGGDEQGQSTQSVGTEGENG